MYNAVSSKMEHLSYFPDMHSRVHRVKALLWMKLQFHGWWSMQHQCSKGVALVVVLGCKLGFLVCSTQPAGKGSSVKMRWEHIYLISLWVLFGRRCDPLQPADVAACPWGYTELLCSSAHTKIQLRNMRNTKVFTTGLFLMYSFQILKCFKRTYELSFVLWLISEILFSFTLWFVGSKAPVLPLRFPWSIQLPQPASTLCLHLAPLSWCLYYPAWDRNMWGGFAYSKGSFILGSCLSCAPVTWVWRLFCL